MAATAHAISVKKNEAYINIIETYQNSPSSSKVSPSFSRSDAETFDHSGDLHDINNGEKL